MGEGGEIDVSIVNDHPRVAQVEPRIIGVEFENFKAAIGIQDGKRSLAGNLHGALCHPHQQPGSSVKSESSRIQKARPFHAVHTGTDICGLQQRIFSEASCQILHRGLFALGKGGAATLFAAQLKTSWKPSLSLRPYRRIRKGVYSENL